MGRRAADDFQRTCVAQLSKRSEQIAFPFVDKETPARRKQFKVKLRQLSEIRLIAVSVSLTHGQIDQKIEVPDVALTQKFVLQHRAQRRCQRHRELEWDVVVHEALHHLQQRDIRFGDCLEEPVFLEKMLVLGMPDERQVRMKNEREMIHCKFQISNCRLKQLRLNLKSAICNLQLQRSAEILQPIETFFDDVDAGRVTEANSAIIAKGRAGHDRHIRFAEQAVGEIL